MRSLEPFRRVLIVLALGLGMIAAPGAPVPEARAQEAAPLRFTVRAIENEAGMRVILEFTRKPAYEVRGDAKRIYVTLNESDVEAPFKKKDFGSTILDRMKFAEGMRTSEIVLFTGHDFGTFATFEMGEPFRIVVDLHRKEAPSMTVNVPGPGAPSSTRGAAGAPPGGAPGPAAGGAPAGPAGGPTASGAVGKEGTGGPAAPPPRSASPTPPRSAFVVVIDPGHGGDDTGARGPSGLLEKDVTLDIARRLKARIVGDLDAQVLLTRDADHAIALDERTAIANHNHADLFVCIHANASRRTNARGAETYFLSYQATDDDSRAVAAIENNALGLEEGVQGSGNLQMVLWDLAQSAFLKESSALAEIVQENLNDALDIRNRGIKQAPFRVLMGATMPAVLIEVAFISNPDEEKRLKDPAFKDRLSGAIFDSVKRFGDKYVKDRTR